MSEEAAIYRPRQPRQSALWSLLDEHFEAFGRDYGRRFVRGYGFLPPVVDDAVRDYLKCGDLREGFARSRCPDCCHGYLLDFSSGGAGSALVVTPKRGFSSESI